MTTECQTDQDGTKRYYLDGQLHRTDGPAIEWANGDKLWYLNGQPHRTDGPAVECADGYKSWYVQGEYLGSGEGCLCLDCFRFCKQQCQNR